MPADWEERRRPLLEIGRDPAVVARSDRGSLEVGLRPGARDRAPSAVAIFLRCFSEL